MIMIMKNDTNDYLSLIFDFFGWGQRILVKVRVRLRKRMEH